MGSLDTPETPPPVFCESLRAIPPGHYAWLFSKMDDGYHLFQTKTPRSVKNGAFVFCMAYDSYQGYGYEGAKEAAIAKAREYGHEFVIHE